MPSVRLKPARAHPDVDATQIAVTGVSQGGGLTIAAAGLVPDVVAAMPDVPFLCHYRRATELVDTYPYKEIADYCHTHRDKVETVFNTLSYFDGVNFAVRAKAKTLFSTALMDQVCPPSTVYAAYNHWTGEKDIKVYPYNGHEGGGSYQTIEKLKFHQKYLEIKNDRCCYCRHWTNEVGELWDIGLRELAFDAIQDAVKDSGGLKPQALFVGNMLAPNLSNQAHLGALIADYAGLTGIEAMTLEAAGASGGAALRQGYLAIASGMVDVALVIGVEKFTDKIGPGS